MALVQVLFESHPGPAIPESDPELRAVLLDSLKTYEHEEAQRPAFGGQPHIPVPEASSSAGTRCRAFIIWHFTCCSIYCYLVMTRPALPTCQAFTMWVFMPLQIKLSSCFTLPSLSTSLFQCGPCACIAVHESPTAHP